MEFSDGATVGMFHAVLDEWASWRALILHDWTESHSGQQENCVLAVFFLPNGSCSKLTL